jgi:hypothetical protein
MMSETILYHAILDIPYVTMACVERGYVSWLHSNAQIPVGVVASNVSNLEGNN